MTDEPSELFQEFVEAMGEKISLEGWTGYKGDMGRGKGRESKERVCMVLCLLKGM